MGRVYYEASSMGNTCLNYSEIIKAKPQEYIKFFYVIIIMFCKVCVKSM